MKKYAVLIILLLFSTPVYGFSLNTALVANSSDTLIDSERHFIFKNNMQCQEDVVSADLARVEYKSRFQAFGGESFYSSDFSFNVGEQSTGKAFEFKGSGGVINQMTFLEKTGVETFVVDVGDSDLSNFMAHGINIHQDSVSVNYFGAAAGVSGRATAVSGYISSSDTTLPGTLSFGAVAEGITGKMGGSVIAVEQKDINIPDVQVGGSKQVYRRSFTVQGKNIEFDFGIDIAK